MKKEIITIESLKFVDSKIESHFKQIERESAYQKWLYKNWLGISPPRQKKLIGWGILCFHKLESMVQDIKAKKSDLNNRDRVLVLDVYDSIVGV